MENNTPLLHEDHQTTLQNVEDYIKSVPNLKLIARCDNILFISDASDGLVELTLYPDTIKIHLNNDKFFYGFPGYLYYAQIIATRTDSFIKTFITSIANNRLRGAIMSSAPIFISFFNKIYVAFEGKFNHWCIKYYNHTITVCEDAIYHRFNIQIEIRTLIRRSCQTYEDYLGLVPNMINVQTYEKMIIAYVYSLLKSQNFHDVKIKNQEGRTYLENQKFDSYEHNFGEFIVTLKV